MFPAPSLTLVYPEVADRFDWSVDPVNLQQELDSFDLGKRRKGIVDSLIKLHTLAGDPETVLCHAELHNKSMGFAKRSERMLDYWMPIYTKKRQPIVPLLLFTHTGLPKEPQEPIPGEASTLKRYSIQALGGGVDFFYHAEWIKNIMERCGDDFFETSTDPAAIFIHAHLKTLETRGDFELRAEEKYQLFRRMGELGMSEKETVDLYRLVGRVMKLPEDLDLQVKQKVLSSKTDNQGKDMEVTVDLGESIFEKALKERAMEQAMEEATALVTAQVSAQAMTQTLATQLEEKFGIPQVEGIDKIKVLPKDRLEELTRAILKLATIEELDNWLEDHSA